MTDRICKCGHPEEEHDMVYAKNKDAFCFHSNCSCLNFEEPTKPQSPPDKKR